MTSHKYNKFKSEIIKLEHLAIIMDGNRRWAKARSLKSHEGHKAGINNAIKLLKSININNNTKIKYITLYIFAVNNWKRSISEIKYLFKSIEETYDKFEKLSLTEKFNISHIGSTKNLPRSIIKIINDVSIRTKKNKGIKINLAFNYSGREEILNAIKLVNINKKKNSKFNDYLYTAKFPDPDLIIRTGGELRISDFMLWQSAYSELYFTKILWPDFKFNNLRKALLNYKSRSQNYGK